MRCARHPKIETVLACGRCGRAICPSCSVSGPVGMRCRDCASVRSSHLYKVKPERFVLAMLLGIAAGTIVGYLLNFVSTMFVFVLFFIGPAIGGFIGDLILRATGNKRGIKLEILAGVSVIGGAIIAQTLSGGWTMLFFSPLHLIIYILAVGLTASGAIGRIRF